MRRYATVSLIVLFALSCALSCRRAEQTTQSRPPTETTANGAGARPIGLRHAKGFSASRDGDLTRVVVTVPWRDEPFRYLLVPRGSVAADPGATVVQVPLQTAVVISTTYVGHLRQLGMVDRIVAVSNGNHVNDPEIRAGVDAGRIGEVGIGPTINVEAVVEAEADAVLLYGIGEPANDTHHALARSGETLIMTSEFYEDSPLARAEWIKFFALLFGKLDEAELHFAEVERRYTALAKQAADQKARPTVILNAEYRGTWYIPGGRNYIATYLKDAGADYLWAADPSSRTHPIDAEVVIEKGSEADYWLHPGMAHTMAELLSLDQRYTAFAAVKNCNVFNYDARTNGRGGNDFWETGLVRPHDVLADLVRIFHPELLPDRELAWYRNIGCAAE